MAHPYIPLTDQDRVDMLAAVGVDDVDDLFREIPAEQLDPAFDLPDPLSEPELLAELKAIAAKSTSGLTSFLGAGAYQHFIPSTVDAILSRGEYLTAYTPYQPEISQGTLQTTFEFQSLVCELTGMEIANAGMYDGASSMAEACLMACSITGRERILLTDTIHPNVIETVRTYAAGRGLEIAVMPTADVHVGDHHACVAVQQPNFLGQIEDLHALGGAAHGADALFIVSQDPVSLGLYRPPSAFDADIVVGDGQPLGVPVSFGGPYVGLFACRAQYARQMPGRIVGRTKDLDGKTGYVLTLQTREQHIRRERATSNICTSTQLVALGFTIALCTLGKHGLRTMAELCYHKAHYAADQIATLAGYELALDSDFFQEFVIRCSRSPAEVNTKLLDRGIIGGYDVSGRIDHGLLLCVSELHTRKQIDQFVTALGEIGG